MKTSYSEFEAIGFALAGFTCWVLADSIIKMVGSSQLPAYEAVAFLGLFVIAFLLLHGWVAQPGKVSLAEAAQAADPALLPGSHQQPVRGRCPASFALDVVLHPRLHGSDGHCNFGRVVSAGEA